ncbi:MAG: signal peptidase I [Lachnospiraceae bacterium]|nr:signal peptidase I [Lachnospiraceae bacterium]
MNKVLKELFSLGIYILCILGLTFLVIKFVGQRTVVDGSSMETTLQNGDSLWVDKISYRFKGPERFDVIVFPHDDVYLIKRVIALPGERIRIDENGNIYINGEKLEEDYGREVIDADHIGVAWEDIQLGDDEYFVMGDNRNNSTDSRYPIVGNIKKSRITGKAVIRIWPFSKFGKFR